MNVVFSKRAFYNDFVTSRHKTPGITPNAWVRGLLTGSIGSAVKNCIALYIGFSAGEKRNVTKFNVTKLTCNENRVFRRCGQWISLHRDQSSISTAPGPLRASPGVFKSCWSSPETECNENTGGVTKMLLRSKNVTKCNEKWNRLVWVSAFVTFRYTHALSEHFRYTCALFVTPNGCVCSVAFQNAQDLQQHPGRGAAFTML